VVVSPTGQPEAPTPAPTETPNAEPTDGGSQPEEPVSPPTSPQVLAVQLSELDGTGGEQRVRGTVSVSYQVSAAPDAITSVLFSIGNLDAGNALIEPGDVTVVDVGEPSPVGSDSGGCVSLADSALPVSLESAIPIVTCTEAGGGAYRQDVTFEFPATSAATIDDYRGSILLTMAIAS